MEVTISLNPDGSGYLVYNEHFDRADEETRNDIREQLASGRMSSPLDEDQLTDLLPALYFKIVSHKHDKYALRRNIIVEFKDINSLLAADQADAFNLTGLDFTVHENALHFSLPAMPEDMQDSFSDTVPPRYTLTIFNVVTGEKISCFREVTGAAIPGWKAQLPFKQASFKRKTIKKLFTDLPVIQAGKPRLSSAAWHISEGQFSSSFLQLDLMVPFNPATGTNFRRWINPVILEGEFDNGNLAELYEKSPDHGGMVDQNDKPTTGSFHFPIKLKRPDQPVSRLEKIRIRFLLEKAQKTETKPFEPSEKGAKLEIDGADFTITDLSDTDISLSFSNSLMRFARLFQLPPQKQKIELIPGLCSTSGDTKKIHFEPVAKIEGSVFLVEAYSGISSVYLDLTVDPLDLTHH